MKKILITIVAFILLLPITANSAPPAYGSSVVAKDANCNQSKYYPIGKLCADTDDGKLYKGTGSAVQEITYYDPASVAITGGTVSGTSITVSDYQYIPVDAGMDSVIAAPDATIRVQGVVGASKTITPANVSYGTFTINGDGINIDAAVYGSGTQTATFSISGLTVGQLYLYQFTPTVTGQVPTFTATSGVGSATIPTVVSATVENIYFRATATTAVFTATNTGASTWSTASTTCKAYARPAYAREYSNSSQQSLVFDWMPPKDWNAGTITFIPYGVVTNATAPANTETIIMSISGFCVPTSGSLSTATGTAVSSTFTADANYVQYDEWIGTETTAITLAGAAAGSKCRIMVDRLTTGTYAQKAGFTGGLIKFTRTIAP